MEYENFTKVAVGRPKLPGDPLPAQVSRSARVHERNE